jgi:hypothetical protein
MHLHNLYTDIAKITQRSYKEKGGNLKPLLGSIWVCGNGYFSKCFWFDYASK